MGSEHRSAAGPATITTIGATAAEPAAGPGIGSAVGSAGAGSGPVPGPGWPPGLIGLVGRRIRACRRTRDDLLIALGCGAADLASYFASGHTAAPHASVVGALLITAGAAALFFRRRFPTRVLGVLVALHVALSAVVTMHAHNFSVSVAVALYTVARNRGARAIGAAALAALAGQAAHATREASTTPLMVFGDALFIALVIAVGVWVRRWREQVTLNRRLLAERAVTEERRRIARELHDIVAHHLTTMYLMSGGARATLDRDPETAREALVTLESSGRTALREMRQLLGVLRGTDVAEDAPSAPQPGIREIDRLLVESRAAGLPVEFEALGEPGRVPLAIGLTLYRIVQEALTNARKHAGDARACVRLEFRSDLVAVEICDDGDGGRGDTAVGEGGYGLLGMRERVAVHGGVLEVGRRPEGGFRVAALVPLPPAEPGED
ncbi:sensor histidine kinase [Embleya hyalina]|uniref:histidine kinase n=1 Tax=Embleya hyalina TaxID=516124 RepID=A0A401YKH6_9ACTN|nr:histidine kinase [Embleya hyalina]GCD95096.1 two-component sensor histidine kinase [Embleya hyalina]